MGVNRHTGRRHRTTPRALSKQRVLRTAVALADQDGIDALSMPKLAQLGVVPMRCAST